MCPHNSNDSVERLAMDKMQGAELAAFWTHLLQCPQCQDALRETDRFLSALRGALESHPRAADAPSLPPPTGSPREYIVVQAFLPDIAPQDIGILLIDAESDRLTCRFRRDFAEFAPDEAEWLGQLAGEISRQSNELGAARCLEWLAASFFGKVRLPRREPVPLDDNGATTLDGLYAKFIRPSVLRFVTHLPQYSLEAAAGKFGGQIAVEPEGWVEVRTDMPLSADMFVTHVKGHSMEPRIPDHSLCAFRFGMDGSAEGKVVLMEQYGDSGGSSYAVKLYHASTAADPNRRGDPAWLHEPMTLESLNPDYKPLDVASAARIRVLGEFLFVV